jgi:hypothetical protein
MPQFGSGSNLVSQNLSQTVDNQGNPIISSDTTFGASPLGYAARVQALFGLPNATFELTPPDTTLTIDQGNQLPYWDVQEYSAGVMTATAVYDDTTNTWGVKLDPGTATTGDYLTMTTRSYLVNDDNLSLRQKALAVVAKNGTYAGTTQWSLELTASYWDATNTLLHSGTVGTILDNATWTSISGTTTTGGTAISAAAHYVDLTYTLTATAPVTSATSVTLKSTLLQTSSGAGGGGSQSFIVKETFTSSQTWTVPTGVTTLLTVAAYGAGGGGAGGGAGANRDTEPNPQGSQGGGGGALVALQNLDITGVGSVVVTVGAGGSGGSGKTFVKAAGGTAVQNTAAAMQGVNGSNGGATSFGSYLSIGGGGGGTAAVAATSNIGGTAGVGSSGYFPVDVLAAGGGTVRSSAGSPYVAIYALPLGTGGSAGACSFTGGQSGNGTQSGGTGFFGFGGRGAASAEISSSAPSGGGTAGVGGAGGRGGGGGRLQSSGTAALTVTGGNGGAGTAGGGGGAGGAVTATAFTAVYNNTAITATGGNGGTGGNACVVITYVG